MARTSCRPCCVPPTLLHKHGAPSAADELLDRLMEDEPQRAPEILTARARMYAQSSELPKAFAVLEKGEMDYPDSVELRYARASVYEEQGLVSAALRELTLVVKSRPNDPAALNALGFTLADHTKSLSRARKLIERAHAAAPRNPAILDSLGWVYFRQGRPADALPFLESGLCGRSRWRHCGALGRSPVAIGSAGRGAENLVRGQRLGCRQSFAEIDAASSDFRKLIQACGAR